MDRPVRLFGGGRSYLRFHCGCAISQDLGEAAYAIMGMAARCRNLAVFAAEILSIQINRPR